MKAETFKNIDEFKTWYAITPKAMLPSDIRRFRTEDGYLIVFQPYSVREVVDGLVQITNEVTGEWTTSIVEEVEKNES